MHLLFEGVSRARHPFLSGRRYGGMGSLVHTEKEGDVLRWIVEHPKGDVSEIRINTKESNHY